MKFKPRINLITTYIDCKWEIEENNQTPYLEQATLVAYSLAKKTLP